VYTLGQTFVSSDPQEIAYCKARKDIFAVGHVPEPKPVAKKAASPPPPPPEEDEPKEEAVEKPTEAVGRPGPAKKPTGPKTRKKRVKVGK